MKNKQSGNRIEYELKGGIKLVAEKNTDPEYKEIFIFLEDEEGTCIQDIAIAGEAYRYDKTTDEKKEIGDLVRVLVYGEEYCEDYTNRFLIPRYYEPEDREERERELLKEAMRKAGYEFDRIEGSDGRVRFLGEGVQMAFDSWAECRNWLEHVTFDDPEVSDSVEQVLHPERFAV